MTGLDRSPEKRPSQHAEAHLLLRLLLLSFLLLLHHPRLPDYDFRARFGRWRV